MAFGFGGNKQNADDMSAPVVVQGVAVPQGGGYYQQQQAPYVQQAYVQQSVQQQQQQPMSGTDTFNGYKGEKQPDKYNDIAFAIGFYVHLAVMAFLAVAFGKKGGQNNNGNGVGAVGGDIVSLLGVCGLFAMGLSSFALGFMMQFPEQLIKMGLFFSLGLSLLIGILGFMTGQLMMGLLGLLSFAVGCCYAYFVWSRIPFAAANLNTALSAVKQNMGLTLVAYFFLFLAFAWSVWWGVAAEGALAALGQSSLYLFLVSYYWVHQVLQNTVHVTAAGVIGTWWFTPNEASSFCSPAIKDSFIRATTYSFGSICFGSLLVALVHALRRLLHMAREQDECQILVCILDCLLGCLESIIEELNRWAYVYVGLYGYSYLEAGRNVMILFQNKGWTAIISEDLVDNVLLMMSVAIGLMTGLVGLVLAQINRNVFGGNAYANPGLIGFILGFLVGFILASILMSVVGSAVNTVIVCFAESPNEFQQNHPQLSNEMRAAWRQAWPSECGTY